MSRLFYTFDVPLVGFSDDIMRSSLGLHICLRDILSHDSQAEELDPADEYDHTDRGSPSRDGIAEDELPHDDHGQEDECTQGHQKAEPGCDAQGHL